MTQTQICSCFRFIPLSLYWVTAFLAPLTINLHLKKLFVNQFDTM